MKRVGTVAFAVFALFTAAAPASTDTYPDRTITIVVPYPAGGPTDTTAREIANLLSAKFKQNVIVENVTGGSTIVATNKVAHAAPDGYTLLLHNLQITANVTLFKTLPFDTVKDIVPVMLVNKNPLVLVGRPDLPASNLKDLIALMKKKRLREALPGYGTTGHLISALFAQEAEVKVDFIPYRGAAPAMTDLLGSHVDLFVGTPQSIVPQVTAGKLKAFGITAKEKDPRLPTAESLVTALGPKFDIVYWQGLFAPASTPALVIKTLNAALQDVVADPGLLKRWETEGFQSFPKDQLSSEAGAKFMHAEIARWGEVIRDNNIKVVNQ